LTTQNPEALNQVYNTACGERTTLNDLVHILKNELGKLDPKINTVEAIHGPNRKGDIPHSLASVEKAKKLLGYSPQYYFEEGLKEAVQWYFNKLNKQNE